MVKKTFFTKSDYIAPSIREAITSLECGFAASAPFGADDYEDGNSDWIN